MARKTLSDIGVHALKPRAARYTHPDPELSGHDVRVQPSGAKAFCAGTRNPSGKQIWTTIGATDVMPITEARVRAREVNQRVRDGLSAVEAKAGTFAAVAANWLERHVEAKGLRSNPEINRFLNSHILPAWKDREFASIRRSDVAALLDNVEDNQGARQVDHVLAIVRGIMNWYAARNDDYAVPIVRGMGRTNPKERARTRKLSDAEIRAVWKLAEANRAGVDPPVAPDRAAARESRVRWQDISMDGV